MRHFVGGGVRGPFPVLVGVALSPPVCSPPQVWRPKLESLFTRHFFRGSVQLPCAPLRPGRKSPLSPEVCGRIWFPPPRYGGHLAAALNTLLDECLPLARQCGSGPHHGSIDPCPSQMTLGAFVPPANQVHILLLRSVFFSAFFPFSRMIAGSRIFPCLPAFHPIL